MKRCTTVAGRLSLILLLGVTITGAATPTISVPHDAAIEFYKNKLKIDPKDFLSAISLGDVYAAKARLTGAVTDYRKAENAFRRSLAIMPTYNMDAKIGLAAVLTSQHRFKEADAIIKEALSESPNTPMLWALAGDIAFDFGDYDRADGFYKLFAKTKPGLESWSRQAKVAMLNGSWLSAERLWKRICALSPGSDPEPSAWAWVMQGELYLSLGKFKEAMSCYDQSLELLANFRLALEHKAEINFIEKNFGEGISLLEKAIAAGSHDPELWILLGDAFEKAGQHDSAVVAWQKGEVSYRRLLKDGNVAYLRPLALFYLNHKKNVDEARKLAQRDLTIREDYGGYLTLARAYLQLGRKKEALNVIQKSNPKAENDPQFCFHAGEIFLANGNISEALRLFTQASRICPAFDQIYGTDLATKLSELSRL